MNRENIQSAINVMHRVQENELLLNRVLFDMSSFNNAPFTASNTYDTEEKVLSSAGTTCCVSGWLAVSPEFKALGVVQKYHGAGVLKEPEGYVYDHSTPWDPCVHPSVCLAMLFDIPHSYVHQLIYGNTMTVNQVIVEMKKWLWNSSMEPFHNDIP